MFKILHAILNSNELFNVSEEVEILKGWYEKPRDIKDSISKIKRKYKFKK